MDRIIKLSDLQDAVARAYDTAAAEPDNGAVDPRLAGTDPASFGISLILTDGTEIAKGDTDASSLLGSIARVPVSLALLDQIRMPADIFGRDKCRCACAVTPVPDVPVSKGGVRAVSAIEPVGDADGKWNVLSGMMIDLMGSSPALDDRFLERQLEANYKAETENALADASYFLYDDAAISINLYSRLISMRATVRQLAVMGATIAADGYNPVSRLHVFDSALAPRVVSMMAVKGPHGMSKPWLISTGLPARSSFGGAMMGVMPGLFGIAAYSPQVNDCGVSVRAAHALTSVMQTLGLSALGSARVRIE